MRRNEVLSALKQAEPADKDASRKFGFDEFMDVYFLLQERLGTSVDYGTREGLHPVLRPAIEREAIRVF